MIHSRNTLRCEQREITQGKSHRRELWVGPQGEWEVKRKRTFSARETTAGVGKRTRSMYWGGGCGRLTWWVMLGSTVGGHWGVEESLEDSSEEGIWKSSFFLMANTTVILSSSTSPSVLQEVYIQRYNCELIMLNKKIKNMYRLMSEGLLGKVLSLPHIF